MRLLNIYILIIASAILCSCENKNSDDLDFFFSKTGVDYSKYTSISSINRSNTFAEFFNNNNNNWPTGIFAITEYATCSKTLNAASGYYSVDYNNSEALVSEKIQIKTWNPSSDFEIRVKLTQFKKYSAESETGVIWGGESNLLYFKIKTDNYQIAASTNDSWNYLQDWTYSSILKTDGSDNELAIRKIATKYFFFINKVLVHSHSVAPITSKDNTLKISSQECNSLFNSIEVDKLVNLTY